MVDPGALSSAASESSRGNPPPTPEGLATLAQFRRKDIPWTLNCPRRPEAEGPGCSRPLPPAESRQLTQGTRARRPQGKARTDFGPRRRRRTAASVADSCGAGLGEG